MNSEDLIIDRESSRSILLDIRGPVGGHTVIFCHGYKGFKDWGCWNLMADYLANRNICIVKFNFSCNGGTLSNPIDFPDLKAFGENNYSKEIQDLNDVIDVIEQEYGFSSLTLIGHSRGGGIVTIVGAGDNRISKVVSWAGVSDFSTRFPKGKYLSKWKENGVFYVKNGRTGQEMPHFWQFYEDFDKSRNRLSIQKSVSSLSVPFLIIHGSEDEAVNVNEAFNLKKWGTTSRLQLVHGAGHTFGASEPWPETELPEALTEVLDQTVKFILN